MYIETRHVVVELGLPESGEGSEDGGEGERCAMTRVKHGREWITSLLDRILHDRERQRQRESESVRERQTERQTDRQTRRVRETHT
jgi:hypothetical protein